MYVNIYYEILWQSQMARFKKEQAAKEIAEDRAKDLANMTIDIDVKIRKPRKRKEK